MVVLITNLGAEAFERFAGVDVLATLSAGPADRDGLAAQAIAAGVSVAADDTWSDIFSKVLVEHVEPHLGQGRLTILSEYPSPEAALARTKPSDPRVAERFEVLVREPREDPPPHQLPRQPATLAVRQRQAVAARIRQRT